MENTQTTQPITNINTDNNNIIKKQILVTFNDNDILTKSKLYGILNNLSFDKIILQYETLDFIIETNTFNHLNG